MQEQLWLPRTHVLQHTNTPVLCSSMMVIHGGCNQSGSRYDGGRNQFTTISKKGFAHNVTQDCQPQDYDKAIHLDKRKAHPSKHNKLTRTLVGSFSLLMLCLPVRSRDSMRRHSTKSTFNTGAWQLFFTALCSTPDIEIPLQNNCCQLLTLIGNLSPTAASQKRGKCTILSPQVQVHRERHHVLGGPFKKSSRAPESSFP